MEEIPSQVADIFVFYENSSDIEVQEICTFALHLATDLVRNVLTPELDYDPDLSFLDKFVEENKTKDYVPPEERGVISLTSNPDGIGLNTIDGPYGPGSPNSPNGNGNDESVVINSGDQLETTGLDMVWGPEGLEEPSNNTNDQQSIFDTAARAAAQAQGISFAPPATVEPPSLFAQLSKQKKTQKVDKKKAALLDAFKSAAGDENINNTGAVVDAAGSLILDNPYSPNHRRNERNNEDEGEERVGLDNNGVDQVYGVGREIGMKKEEEGPPPEEYTKHDPKTIFKDKNLRAGYWIEKGTLVLVIQNTTPKDYEKFGMKLQVGPGIESSLQETHPSQISSLAHGKAAWLKADTKLIINENVFPKLQFVLQVSFDDQHVAINVPVLPFGYIEPLKMSTKDYGTLWTKGGKEQNCIIPKGNAPFVKPISDISEIITTQMNFFSVQRIKEEEIFAAKIIGTDLTIQLHAKRTAVKIQVKVLTQIEELTKAIVAAVPFFIKE